MDALQEFNLLCSDWGNNFISLFDLRIEEAKGKIEMYQLELKHWEEMKKVYLQAQKNNEIKNN